MSDEEEPWHKTAPARDYQEVVASTSDFLPPRKSRSREPSKAPSPAPPKKRGRKAKTSKKPDPKEKEKKKRKVVNSQKDHNSKSTQERFAEMKLIFQKVKPRDWRHGVEEVQEKIKETYREVKEEYDEAVENELENQFSECLNGVKWNLIRHNVNNGGYRIPKFTSDYKTNFNDSKVPESCVSWSKPDRDESGNMMKHVPTPCSRVEVGDINPVMIYWVPIEQSIPGKEQLRLTHMPYFNEDHDDNEIFDLLIEKFPDGIHGFANSYNYMNDWILFKLFDKVLNGYSGQPDMLYYGIYRLWPNKMSQRELSDTFTDLSSKYAEEDFNPYDLEPWKPLPVVEVAANLQSHDCYACFDYTCQVHGFRPEIPPDFNDGDFFYAKLPISSANDETHCSNDCWKKIDIERIKEILDPDEEELEQGSMPIYLDKARLARMPIENGAMIATQYPFNFKMPFCEFTAKMLEMEDEESGFNTCRKIYKLIMGLVENSLTADRYAATRPPELHKHCKRVQRFRWKMMNEENTKAKRRKEELNKKAVEQGLNLDKLIEEDDAKNSNKKEKVQLTAVKPLRACRHSGPCGAASEDCACKENGVCTYLCKCDVNCSQRFPGCNCTLGQCQTKACQCYRANWECNPHTCKQCGCENIDDVGKLKCKNFSMTRMISKRMICAPSKIAGNGLFLLDPAEKDELITEYVGERISDDEAERRGAIYDRYQCSYIFNLETGGAIDAYKIGNLARFANNDTKNPSCYAKIMVIAGEHRIGFFAKRSLEVNEEITFNYSYSENHQIAFNMIKGSNTAKGPRREESSKSSTSSGSKRKN